ncbi:hypothetical protein [Pseudomonas cavernicola]|uniref:hypothetical protein n=1 Tax=Pseudomonas cavernicola TaxID=2320866 RepID=UPI0011C3AC91|nr:hypothetical protein [Pseudomonas cavernicola]
MEDTALFRVFRTLAGIACVIVVGESFRTGSTISFGRSSIGWVSKDVAPVGFWVANVTLLAFAVLGFTGGTVRKK